MNTFFGYGTWNAPIWFVGMEEGGGNDLAEIQRRLEAWNLRGRRELEDLVSYHRDIGVTRHIGEKPSLQSTWSKLVRVLFGMANLPPHRESIRKYQGLSFGREAGTTSLVELLPLPSPGLDKWFYGTSELPFLRTRDIYRDHVRPFRAEAIRRRILESRPKVVAFYGLTYLQYWSNVAGVSLEMSRDPFFSVTVRDTLFLALRHPVSHGVTNEYFAEAGHFLVERDSSLARHLTAARD